MKYLAKLLIISTAVINAVELRSNWHCFHFYGGPDQSVHFELITGESPNPEIEWSVFAVKGSSLKKDLDYLHMDQYVCDDTLVNAGLCTAEEKGTLRKDIMTDLDHYFEARLLPGVPSVNFTTLAETDSYCTYVLSIRGDLDSRVKITPNYKDGLPPEQVMVKSVSVWKSFLSLVLILVYLNQWRNKEMAIDMVNKLAVLYFIISQVVIPLLVSAELSLEENDHRLWDWLFTKITRLFQIVASTAYVCFLNILAKGFTALPKAEYPLNSKYFRPCFVIGGVFAALSLVNMIVDISGLVAMVVFGITVYQIVEWKKTGKMLTSMSLRSSSRRTMTLKWLLFIYPLCIFGSAIVFVVVLVVQKIDIVALINDSPDWSATLEMLSTLFMAMLDAFVLFVVLYRYWTPEAIYLDSFGFEPTIDLNTDLDDIIV